jgi:hypothetical protein
MRLLAGAEAAPADRILNHLNPAAGANGPVAARYPVTGVGRARADRMVIDR